MTSTSFITGAGLKKCTPTTLLGRPVPTAMSVTDSDEVLVARTASSRHTRSSSAKTVRFRSSRSGTASMTRSQSPRSANSVVSATRPRISRCASSVSRPRFTARPVEVSRCPRPRSSASSFTSTPTTLRPPRPSTSAMPAPTVPSPTTPTLLNEPPPMERSLAGRSRAADGRYDACARIGILLLATRFPRPPETPRRAAGESAPDSGDAAALTRTVEAAVAAERAGFDDVWLAEHHFMSYGVVPSATLMAGHLLAVTRRVRVGTAVSVLSNRHPVALAEEAAMLALLSGGRFDLGVGRGGPWRDLEVFGTGLARYEHGFAESLDLLLAWLRSERVGWSGDHFRFREVPVVPRAPAPPPVTVACTSPATEALAAERGLPMLLGMHVGADEKAAAVARHGLPDAPHVSAHVAQVADTREQAVKTLMEEM